MYDIVGVGECLIDFTPLGREAGAGYPAFEQNPGGAPANLAAAAAAMGAKAAVLGKVGADRFGGFLRRVLDGCGVETRGLVAGRDCHTTLAFVHLEEDGQREFEFCRSADQRLREEELDWTLVEHTRVLHVSSLAFSGEDTARAARAAIARAKACGSLVSYDANWRPMLWEDQAFGKEQLAVGNGFADILKASEEELRYITGESGEEAGARRLLDGGVRLVLVTRGGEGSAVYTQNVRAVCPAFSEIRPVDTTGAGDICFGTFLVGLLKSGKDPAALDAGGLRGMLRAANAAAGLSVARRGGIPSIPAAGEVEAFLKAHPAG